MTDKNITIRNERSIEGARPKHTDSDEVLEEWLSTATVKVWSAHTPEPADSTAIPFPDLPADLRVDARECYRRNLYQCDTMHELFAKISIDTDNFDFAKHVMSMKHTRETRARQLVAVKAFANNLLISMDPMFLLIRMAVIAPFVYYLMGVAERHRCWPTDYACKMHVDVKVFMTVLLFFIIAGVAVKALVKKKA